MSWQCDTTKPAACRSCLVPPAGNGKDCFALVRLALRFHLLPTVAQGNDPVEDQIVRLAVLIDDIVSKPFELNSVTDLCLGQRGFDLGGGGRQRFGVQVIKKGFAVLTRFRVLDLEQSIVVADLCGNGVIGADPMNRSFDFSPRRIRSALGCRVISAQDFADVAIGIVDDILAVNDISGAVGPLRPSSNESISAEPVRESPRVQ